VASVRGGSGILGSVEVAASLSVLGLVASAVLLLVPHEGSTFLALPRPDALGSEALAPISLARPTEGIGSFSLTIVASDLTGEVGIAATFTAEAQGGVPPCNVTWSDSEGDRGTGGSWTVAPAAPGTLTVQASAVDSVGELAVGSYGLPVMGPLSLAFPAHVNATDLGEPVEVTLDLGGGVPPYRVDYALPGQPLGFANAPHEGSLELLVTPSAPGPAYLSVNLTDALGAGARSVGEIAAVAGALSLAWDDLPSFAEVDVPVTLRADASGGTPPLSWSALVAGPLSPGSNGGGTIGSPGLAVWSGSFEATGNVTVVLTTVDARGVATSIRASLGVAPVLSLTAGPPDPSVTLGTAVAVRIAPLGGAPPYSIVGQASDGETSSALLGSGQNLTWTLEPPAAANLSISLRATDALGGVASAAWIVAVDAPPPAPSPPSDGPTGGPGPLATAASTLVLVGGGALGLFVWWRRRSGAARVEPRAPLDLSDLERMFADGEPVERATLYNIGEEQGLPRSTVAAQIEEARRTGRITVERAVTGEEVFRWVDPPVANAPTEARP
jgi:hypothetical protein